MNETLRLALERVTANFRSLLAGKPVRDAAETLAECDRAISIAKKGPQYTRDFGDYATEDVMAWIDEQLTRCDAPMVPFSRIPADQDVGDALRWLRANLFGIKRTAAEQAALAVGIASAMPGAEGFTMAGFKAADVPAGTNLYTKGETK